MSWAHFLYILENKGNLGLINKYILGSILRKITGRKRKVHIKEFLIPCGFGKGTKQKSTVIVESRKR